MFLGIALLVLASALIALSAARVTGQSVALLGIIPLGFGLWRFWAWSRRQDCSSEADVAVPARRTERRALAQVVMVTTLTMANGGDNLMAYAPLFAAEPARIPIYAAVFAFLTAGWCVLAYFAVNNRVVRLHAHRVDRWALPVVMVWLGLWTLSRLMRRAG